MGYEVFAYTKPVICPIDGENTGVCTKPCADILITDYNMPLINGLELLQELTRKKCALISKNKALISGFLETEQLKKLDELGCVFFQKPLDFSELLTWLAECEKRIDRTQPLIVKRTEKRYPASDEITYLIDDQGDLLKGSAVNISNLGLCLKLGSPLVNMQKVLINTRHPIASRIATVRWTGKLDDGAYLAGLKCCETPSPSFSS